MGAGTPARPRSQTSVSASSIVRCAAASDAGTSSAAKRIESERPIGLLQQLLHLPFCLRELVGRAAQPPHALFEQLKRTVERNVGALELGDDSFEAREIGFESHGWGGCSGSSGSSGCSGERRTAF